MSQQHLKRRTKNRQRVRIHNSNQSKNEKKFEFKAKIEKIICKIFKENKTKLLLYERTINA